MTFPNHEMYPERGGRDRRDAGHGTGWPSQEYDGNEDGRRCWAYGIRQIRLRLVSEQQFYWRDLQELYAWEAGPCFGGAKYG